MKERVIIVLGMHRSGTSILSAALECLGVRFGDNLLGPREDNPMGFWEDADFVELNERLYELGGSFSSALGFELEKVRNNPAYPQLHQQMKALLRDRLDKEPLFGLKDPRMPRLIELWGEVLDEMGVEVAFVVPLRNPLSVAASLARRDDFPTGKSLLLWYEHMVRGLCFAYRREMLVVDYDAFLDMPRESLHRLAERLALGLDGDRFIGFARDTLSDGLRHSRFSDEALRAHQDSFPALHALHVLLKRLSRDEVLDSCGEITQEIYQAEQAFAQLWPVLRRCGQLDVELWGGSQHLKEVASWTASLEAVIRSGEQERLLEQVRQAAHLQEKQALFDARESELLAWIATLEGTIQAGEEQRRLSQDWLEGQLQRLEALANQREQQTQLLDERLTNTWTTLQQLQNSRSWRLTKPLRWCGRLLNRS